MLDIRFIQENPGLIKENLAKRFQKEKMPLVDKLIKDYNSWLDFKKQAEHLRHERNLLSEAINRLKKGGENPKDQLKQVKEIPEKIKLIEERQDALSKRIQDNLLKIPNIIHKDVPAGEDSTRNKEIRKWGKPKKPDFQLLSHVELAEKSVLADFDQARKVSGAGFNFLLGDLAMLDLALQRYAIELLLKKGFIYIATPLLLNKKAVSGAINFGDFENVIYKIENEDLYLLPTGEHSLINYFQDKIFSRLPLKVCTLTPCFRKEIGGHGVDAKGLFRMHQFYKVEQVVCSTQEDSFKMLEEMQTITEEFFKSLDIPFRVVEICSGDLGDKFARQYDIEAWFPRQEDYKEVTSAGNTTDFQARRLNVRYEHKGERRVAHLLNNTMVATSRAMVAILENYQNEDGSVTIPKVLIPYMNGKKKI